MHKVIFIVLVFLAVLAPGCAPAEKQFASLVLTNGFIYTVDQRHSVAQAMAVQGDTIVYAGDHAGVKQWIGPQTRVIDLENKTVLPGFIDSHLHAASGVSDIFEINLNGIETPQGYQQAIKDFVQSKPGLPSLLGAGWVNAAFGEHGPTASLLDEVVRDIPVVLYSQDYHSVWVNSKALELAGISTATADVAGGVIERDANGYPSGTFRENAVKLVQEVIPPYSSAQILQGLTYFQDYAHSLGITTVYIPSYPNGEENGLQALHDLETSGKMTLRLYSAMAVQPGDGPAKVSEITARRKAEAGGNFEIVGAKIFLDGVLESMTAYLEAPYVNQPGSRGERAWDAQAYNEMCAALDKAGIQVHVHAMGDAAAHQALDGFAYARQQNGAREARNMITHLQLVNPEDISRFAGLGVIAVPQPYWHTLGIYYRQSVGYLGQERADRQYPLESFFKAGVKVAAGSDYPVTKPPDPLLGMQIGVTRSLPVGEGSPFSPQDAGALNPAEAATLEQMIEAFTINGAYALFKEKELGSLEVGKKADFIILSDNLLKVTPEEIYKIKVLRTFLNGQQVYAR